MRILGEDQAFWLLGTVIFILSGCGSPQEESSSIQFQIQKPSATLHRIDSLFEPSTTPPGALNDLECVGFMAGYVEELGNVGSCDLSDGGKIPVAKAAGLAPYSSSTTSSLGVGGLRSGEMEVVVFAMDRPETLSFCDKIEKDFTPKVLGYSNPFILARKVFTAKPGENEIVLSATFKPNAYITRCDSIWDQNQLSLTSSLLAYWDFDDAPALTSSTDSAGSYNLTWTAANANGPAAKNGLSKAVSSVSYINTTTEPTFVLGSEESLTITGWYYFTANPGAHESLWATDAGDQGFRIRRNSSNRIVVELGYSPFNWDTYTSVFTVGTGQLVHLSFRIENKVGGRLSMCKNGPPCQNETVIRKAATANGNLYMTEDAGDYYIDEIGLWGRYLSRKNLEELYSGGAGKFYNSTLQIFE